MMEMLPVSERTPDSQYRDRLQYIMDHGEMIKDTPQGYGALTVFGHVPAMVFDLKNGAPLTTIRKISFWPRAVGELLAFVNGVRSFSGLEKWGCNWWGQWQPQTEKFGLDSDDLGPGSYGAAFHDFPQPVRLNLILRLLDLIMGRPKGFDQLKHVVGQLQKYPYVRTAFVSPWIPYYIGRGGHQKAVVSPCHGWMHFRVINGRLDLNMWQRSADFPVGVPSNTIQYAALLMAVAQVTGYKTGKLIHNFSDAHIYENQLPAVEEMLGREPRPLPTMKIDQSVTDLFAFRPEHFTITDYDPHPAIKDIPVAT